MRKKLLYVGMQYDYGDKRRGLSFEHHNFYCSLKSFCIGKSWEFLHYDFMERGQQIGNDLMTEELLALAKKEQPDFLFAVLADFGPDPRHDVFSQISALGTSTIHWFCDDHWRFKNYSSQIAPHFDLVCTTAQSAVPKYQELGMRNRVIKSQWACNHELYVPYNLAKDVEISFVGMLHGDRQKVIGEIMGCGLTVEVFGSGWPNRPRLPFHQMVRLFSRSKVNLNLANSSSQVHPQIKGRNFEIPGTRSLLLTQNADNLEAYYEDGKEIVTFHSIEELIDKAKFYLKNDTERQRIAEAGYRRTLAEHTWHHRLEDVFRHVGANPITARVEKVAAPSAQPLVSVIMPCYNQAHYLEEAVDSVAAQTYQHWELLIINDGSPDNTSEVAQNLICKHFGKRIRLLEKPNGGLADARNFGIKASAGHYILPLDSDDKIQPQMLERTVEFLEANPGVAIAHVDQICFGALNGSYQMPEYDFKKLCQGNLLNYCSLYRRKVWEETGGYNSNMIWGYEDWNFWVGAGAKGFYGQRVPGFLFSYRIKEESMFTKALEHDLELRSRIVLNHPTVYSAAVRSVAESVLAATKAGHEPFDCTILTQQDQILRLRQEQARLTDAWKEARQCLDDLHTTLATEREESRRLLEREKNRRFSKRWKRFWRRVLPFKV